MESAGTLPHKLDKFPALNRCVATETPEPVRFTRLATDSFLVFCHFEQPETELYPAPSGFHGEEGSEGTEGTVQRLELEGRSVTGEIAWSSQKALSG